MTQATPKRIRVAIVDDDESVRKALKRLLHAAGMDAEAFASGEDFAATLPRHNLDCVLIDSRLAEMEASALVRRLAEGDCSIPAITFVAHDDPKTRPKEDDRDCSPAAIVLKPLNDAVLLRHIRAVVKTRHQ